LQNEKSIEDQIALCKSYAQRLGLKVVGSDYDRAKSGASTFGRSGLTRILEAATRGEFDVLISESPDRISRDMADLAGIHKVLEFRDIEMNCVNGGRMNTIQIGMYGVVGQMQREEGARKTRRGLASLVDKGLSAGGRAYGYRPIVGKPGLLSIVEAEAEIIRRIFATYALGTSPRAIATALNNENVPAPRGTRWNASTINGSDKRGHGILRNPLYSGNHVWNRVRMVKSLSNGKRVSRPNAQTEWQTIELPHLRIVDQRLFDQVAARLAAVGGSNAPHAPKSKRVLSGLLKCGCCGGGLSIIGSDRSGPRVQCSVFKESGTCKNAARYYIEKIERLVVGALRVQLANPELVLEYVTAYREERNRAEREARRKRSSLDRDYAKAKSEIQRIVGSIAKGLITDDEAASLLEPARREVVRLEAEIATAESDTNVIELHPQAVQRFKENIEALADILTTKDAMPDLDLIGTFRSLVERVVVHPRKPGEEYKVSIRGYLASLMGVEMSAVPLVAGEGLEPPTPGL
jgi:site-specific DNA recombinase